MAYVSWQTGVALASIAVAAAVVTPPFRCYQVKHALALSNLKVVATSAAIYQADFDDRFPRATNWMDSTKPYRKNEKVLRTPEVKTGTTVAFTTSMQGVQFESFANKDRQVAFFESTNRRWNASDNFNTAWWQKERKTAVAFVDTSAKAYRYFDKDGPTPGTGLLPGPRF